MSKVVSHHCGDQMKGAFDMYTRRDHSEGFKMQVVKETLEVGNKTLVAGRYELDPNFVQRWVKVCK
jgi:transposase-like protein